MKLLKKLSLVVGPMAIAVSAMAVPAASAAPASSPSQTCTQGGNLIFPDDMFPSSHGGCTSANASGQIEGAGYAAQCKNLSTAFGGYPFTFYGDPGNPTVNNEGQCVNTLRYLHTTYGG